MSIGKQFLSAAIAENSVSALIEFGRIDHLFRASEIDAYEFVRDFVREYHKLPSPDTIEAHTGQTLFPHKEPAAYYHDLMILRHVEGGLKKGMKEASELFLPENKDPMLALQKLTTTIMELTSQNHKKQISDFREAYDMIMGAYSEKWTNGDSMGLSLGWPTLDAMSGGLMKGDVASMVGRPAAGKTWQMLKAAHYGWDAAASDENAPPQTRMFVSMEVNMLAINQRLAAMQTHTPAGQLKKAALSTNNLKKLKDGLTEIQGYGSPFWVVDANLAATVEDIHMIARQLNPEAIFIDGAYLIKHPTERDRFRRVAENCELIKMELAPIAPVVCSWQFAKSASKKNVKKGEKVTMDDIGYTDAIAQISSIVLGLFEEDSVETIKQRRIDILKGRDGETGAFNTAWDFVNMNFDEIVEEDVSDLKFL